MIVTVKLQISPHPKKDIERALIYAAQKLTTEKERINTDSGKECQILVEKMLLKPEEQKEGKNYPFLMNQDIRYNLLIYLFI